MADGSDDGMDPMPTGRLRRLVARVALLGLVAQAAAVLVLDGHGPVATLGGPLGWAGGPALVAVLLLVTVAGDLVAVKVRHGEESEELTLFEAAVVVDVLLLPSTEALVVPVVASLLGSALRRRDPIKTAFNAGNLGAATAALVVTVHLAAGPGEGLSPRTALALLVGTLAFTAINLVALSRVIGLLTGDAPRQVVRDGVRLSALVAHGSVALGATAVTVASAAPALLPLTVMPAAALTFAYRAAAQEAEERERSSQLLALSHLLAGRLAPDELVARFLELVRVAFRADLAVAVLDPDDAPDAWAPRAVVSTAGGVERRAARAAEQRLLVGPAGDATVATDGLLPGFARGLVAPLEAEGRRTGVVLLASTSRRSRLGRAELVLLTPLVSALAVALRGAVHLARTVEESGKLKAVVESSSDGILVVDGTGVVQLWSPALATLTGRSEQLAMGRPLGALVSALAADGTPVDPFLSGRALLSPAAPQATVELVLLRSDGEQRTVRCAHAGVFDETGALVRDVVIVHDVTRERQVERLKADFIATVSHELRTPVTPIKGYADLLRRRGDQMAPEKRDQCLEVIGDRAAHLARLVEDLLLASRISATEGGSPAKVDLAPDDLARLVARACDDFGADGDRIAVRVPDHVVPVVCDRVRVVQVLTNLVGNALKYSDPGSPVDVALDVVGGSAVVEVSDVGRGIPADQLERVFEKFHRVEDPMRMTTGGTGLGLYIARQLAFAMGGDLACRSVLGEGSVFRFALPLAATAPPGVPAPRLPREAPLPAVRLSA